MLFKTLPQKGIFARKEVKYPFLAGLRFPAHRIISKTGLFKKWRLAMKLTTILILVAFTQISARSIAQTVTISRNNISLEKLFRDIHKQTGYNFLSTKEQLSDSRKVDINLKNVSLEDVLEHAFKNQPLTYKILNKTIVVKRKMRPMIELRDSLLVPDPIKIS